MSGTTEYDCESLAWRELLQSWLESFPPQGNLLLLAPEEAADSTKPEQISILIDNLRAGSSRQEPQWQVQICRPGELDENAAPRLPFPTATFNLIIGDQLSAFLHLSTAWLAELRRILVKDGRLLLFDSLVPGTRLRGKKARQLRDAGDYLNAWHALRNPGHRRYLSNDAWTDLFAAGPLTIQNQAACWIMTDFDSWSGHERDALKRLRLRAMLVQAPEKAALSLTPIVSGDRIAFRLAKVAILATASEFAARS